MRKFDDRLENSKRLSELRIDEEESLIKSLAQQHGLTYIDLQGISINPAALQLIPESEARTAYIVAFELQYKKLSVAVRNPNNPETKKILAFLSENWKVVVYMCSTKSLEHAWTRYEDRKKTKAVKKGVLDIDAQMIKDLSVKLTTREKIATYIAEIRTLNTARRVSATLEAIFAGAIHLSASDIHIEPEETGTRLRYRLDGVLHDILNLEQKIYERLASRLKLLAGLKLNVHSDAQDGRFTFDIGEKKIEVRTSVIPGAKGESIVMRLLDPTVASFNMEELGLNKIMYSVMQEEVKRPNGMIVTTGPTGSGKTTALYAFLRKAHTPEVKIITIEDPVEYKVEDIVQTQVDDEYTFALGLRAILRQDPDIIMIGEIRDSDVAQTAVQAAQTGHLVFSTLHTNNAAGAFPRLIDLGIDPRMLGSSINIILGQRLLRILCEHCKAPYTASAEEQELITSILEGHPEPPKIPEPLVLYSPAGCDQCGDTGFNGRQGIFEAIKVDKAVEAAVIRDPREHVVMEAAQAQGIPTMVEDGIEKVIQGITSLEELKRIVDLSSVRNPLPQKHTNETENISPTLDTEFKSHVA